MRFAVAIATALLSFVLTLDAEAGRRVNVNVIQPVRQRAIVQRNVVRVRQPLFARRQVVRQRVVVQPPVVQQVVQPVHFQRVQLIQQQRAIVVRPQTQLLIQPQVQHHIAPVVVPQVQGVCVGGNCSFLFR